MNYQLIFFLLIVAAIVFYIVSDILKKEMKTDLVIKSDGFKIKKVFKNGNKIITSKVIISKPGWEGEAEVVFRKRIIKENPGALD